MLITAVNVAEHPRRFEIPLIGSLPAQPTILFTTDGSPTTELTPRALMLTLPARSGASFDASPAPDHRARTAAASPM
jgi:hypothetical protein